MAGSRTPPDPMAGFSELTRAWFTGAFEAPTAAQAGAWRAVQADRDVLVVAPTGSGKTLAAFLWSLDRLAVDGPAADPLSRCRVLYVSPLKALAVDVERNLRGPLAGIRREALRRGGPAPDITVGLRTGDTPADDRRRLATRPPDILITTPESLFLVLTSRARVALRGVRTVIVDEVHAVAGSKRGAHLAVSLERLDALLERPARRIGLSATVRPVAEVARFLCATRPVTLVDPPADKQVDLQVVVPVDDLGDLAAAGAPGPRPGAAGASAGVEGPGSDGVPGAGGPPSLWPHVEARVVDLVADHRSTLVFANSRRLAERLTARLNEVWQERRSGEPAVPGPAPAAIMAQSGASAGAPPVLARAHHGSVSKEQRAVIEEELKAGRLPAVVATSSLELGIDMGAVDLVVQVESPPSVASGLQRVGRAGHQVGAVSRGVVFPKHRGDLVQTTVVVDRMRAGLIEALAVPRNPLDVLAQQIVAALAVDDWAADELLALVRRAAPFATLPQSAFDAVLDMLCGRYPSDEFAELRPRIVWDRVTGRLTARPGAQRLAVTSGGTIPDRGQFGVFLVGERHARVGELDEEMVYESRVGDVFALGASSWRIEEITHDRVLVTPAPGRPGRLPFWHGDAVGRPAELGQALGAFVRGVAGAPRSAALARLAATGLDDRAATNLLDYVDEQRAATGRVPDDRTLVVERFRDELGDWRVVLHSPYGARVHAPWALVVAARLRRDTRLDAQVMPGDDGLVLRLPDTDDDAAARSVLDCAFADPQDVERIVTEEVTGSALFAARFRECAARALLLPRRTPGRRTPLWQQRQRSAQLLGVAARFGSFPIVLETVRECLQDVYDVGALVRLLTDVQTGAVRVVEVETEQPSPFARSLLFGYVAAYLYEGDSPLAERRAQALTLDAGLLAELLGQAELRELLDADAVAAVEQELQRLTPERRARHAEDAADLLRVLGPLSEDEAAARGVPADWLATLVAQRRAFVVRLGGVPRWAAVEDASRLRDALGAALPVGLPDAFLEPVVDPLGDLVARFARTHGPFTAAEVAQELGLGPAVVRDTLDRLRSAGRVVDGEFRPGGSGTEWCDTQVLRLLRRRSVAALRREVEPVPRTALARFLPGWQQAAPAGTRPAAGGADAVLAVVEQLAGSRLPAGALETLVLPARVAGYAPSLLDELTAAGEVVWWGLGALPGGDGWIALAPAEAAGLLRPAPDLDTADGAVPRAVLDALDGGAAWFFRQLADRVADRLGPVADDVLAEAVWDLVWAGLLTNDTLAPLRALGGPSPRRRVGTPGSPWTRPGRPPRAGGWRPALPRRPGPPTMAGRWSLLPPVDPDPTRRAAAAVEVLLDRHGVLTRGAVTAEGLPGGFAAAYRVLRALEDAGRCRRVYAVEGLGAAQFAAAAAVDRLRAVAGPSGAPGPPPGLAAAAGGGPTVHVLAAADPANPYGAALSWPARGARSGHRPARAAGAVVVLVDGDLVLFVERGGRSLLTWSDDPDVLAPAAAALADAARAGALGRLTVQRADGDAVLASPAARVLADAGFVATPRGLRLRR